MKNSDSNTFAIKPKLLMKVILKSLDSRAKRLVYIASLAAIVRNSKELDSEIIAKMNSVLNLAGVDDASLKLPAFVSDKIWTDKTIIDEDINYLKEHKVTTSNCIDKIKNIINHTPMWFKYASDDVMETDIFNLFCLDKEDIYLTTN